MNKKPMNEDEKHIMLVKIFGSQLAFEYLTHVNGDVTKALSLRSVQNMRLKIG